VKTGGIDSGRIEAMIAQLKAAATRPTAALPELPTLSGTQPATKVNFSDALQGALASVNADQQKADALGKSFSAGDDKVNLSEVMISMQKASISFQASIQVRNKLVSSYHEIMNMQV